MTLILRVRLIMLVCSVTTKNGAVLLKDGSVFAIRISRSLPLLYRMFFTPSRTTGVAAERTIAALGTGEHRSHTAFASQKIIAGMVPDEEPHGLQYIARFPFRGYFCHLYARIRKLRLEKYPVKCLKQAVCQLHLAIYRVGVRF